MDIYNFWKDAPDKTYDIEPLWNNFVESYGGERIDKLISSSPKFANADYIFSDNNVIIELKEVTKDFMTGLSFKRKYIKLIDRIIDENPSWKPIMLGGDGTMPSWYPMEFIKICRNPLNGILKKANKQLRETKEYFDIQSNSGIVVIVNDGFTSLEHEYIQAVIANLLQYSYSSIDCLIYTTVNRYVKLDNIDTPCLLWIPMYSDRAPSELVDYINSLGKNWGDYLEEKMGNFTFREASNDCNLIKGAKSILLPDEKRTR